MAIITTKQGLDIIVDDERLEELNQYKWRINGAHAVSTKGGVIMHRYLTNCPKGMQVYHLNNNTLDNRMENLEIVTPKEHKNRTGQRKFQEWSDAMGEF